MRTSKDEERGEMQCSGRFPLTDFSGRSVQVAPREDSGL